MSQRKRLGCILDRAPAAELDPGNLCKPLAKPKAEPICHCPQQQKARLGGMNTWLTTISMADLICIPTHHRYSFCCLKSVL